MRIGGVAADDRTLAVDVLRGLAIFAVIALHIPHPAVTSPYGLREWAWMPVEFGGLGVTLFIVLSGYCIHARVADRLGRGDSARTDWKSFWRRRLMRLYPPYLAAIALGLLLCWSAVRAGLSLEGGAARFGWDAIAHGTMIHNLTHDHIFGMQNAALWSLGLEFQLYALYAVVLAARRRVSMLGVLSLTFAATIIWSVGRSAVHRFIAAQYGVPQNDQTIDLGPLRFGSTSCWPFSYWFAWVLGAAAAEARSGVLLLPGWCFRRRTAIALAVVGIATHKKLLGALPSTDLGAVVRELKFAALAISQPACAAAFFVLLNRWLRTERLGQLQGRWVAPVAAIGTISYSLYLIHLPIIHGVLEPQFGWSHEWTGVIARFGTYPAICIGAAAVFYCLVERPCLGHVRRAVTRAPAEPRRAA